MTEIGARHWLMALLGAVVLHASALLVFWEPSAAGAPATGNSGIEMSLGPAGAVAGSAAAVEDIDAVAPVAAPQTANQVAVAADATAVPVEAVAPMVPQDAVPVVEQVAPIEPQPVVEPIEVAEAEAVEPAAEVEAREPAPLPEIPPAKPEPPRQVVQPPPATSTTQAAAPQTVAPLAGAEQVAALPGNAGRSGDTEATDTGTGNMTPGGGVPGAPGNDYGKLLSAWIQKHHEFPDRAQRRRQYGEAEVKFAIDRSGKLLHFEVVSSSGYRLLDEAALETMKRADPLPPVPEEMSGAGYTNTIRITFDPPR